MKSRPLGKSGIGASVVGFGAWAIGGWTWGGTDEQESIRAIHAFLDAGGSLIDTAPIYGFGRSEEIVGKAIADRRDQVVLATKCSMRWDLSESQKKRAKMKFSTSEDMFDQPGSRSEGSFDVFIYAGADGIREEVEQSLKRLQTDVIDLYQTHWQDDDVAIEEKISTLEDLRREGKIRAIGVSNASVEQIETYQQFGQVDTDQEKYSMLDRAMEQSNLAKCDRDSIGFLAYSPLSQGLLTGKIQPDREYPEGDQRRSKERFQPDNVQKVNAMLDPMRPIAEKHQVSLAQLTIAWTLAQPGCSHVLAGARNPQQATDNAGAGEVELSSDELATITQAVHGYDGV
ncbi:Predicted oxidoreductase [Neorhodopirellula lusitana]|uniref:Predicted oxidoreductase n=1 Tax=Neorhodopirellula lusitana TaxID=445327 RepID=A0ABY1QP06_9BACT|nr:aldo/keto reductase [Neorhodopirellula lusitana]SMP76056.1 Predicted oxidoreductase [Neorhodopirellula lusitana]